MKPQWVWQKIFNQGWLAVRMTWRDGRARELNLLVLALIIAVASMTSTGFLSDRLSQAFKRDAAQTLGGDLLIESDQPIAESLIEQAQAAGLRVAHTTQFPSMASSQTQSQLVAIKAVDQSYPLHGVLRIKVEPENTSPSMAPSYLSAERAIQRGPSQQSVWVDAQLLALLKLRVGDSIMLGQSEFRIEHVLTYEPDRGLSFINFAPRVLIRTEALPATGLIAPGSRIKYGLLVAGPADLITPYTKWAKARLQSGQKLVTLESGRPEVYRTIKRAQQFLSLVALLAVLISAIAIALAARRFMQRHVDSIAVMRCLGAPAIQLKYLLIAEFVFTGLLASLIGVGLGWGVHSLLVHLLSQLFSVDFPAASLRPALQGVGIGIWLLLSFSLPALLNLCQVSPARILRRDIKKWSVRNFFGYSVGIIGFFGLIYWYAGDSRLAMIIGGGFLSAFAVFTLFAWLGILCLARLRQLMNTYSALHFALGGLTRRRTATIIQICALSIGLMALLLLTMIRSDLIKGWHNTLAPGTPNRYLINIQTDQCESLNQKFKQANVLVDSLLPMVRARLIKINGHPTDSTHFQALRAQQLIEREFNLSYGKIPLYNSIIEGRHLNPEVSEASIEKGLAKTLNLNLGDQLTFNVAGTEVAATITSLRTVNWENMRPNFFAILTPIALLNQPQTWITSFYLPPERLDWQTQLIQEFPNLTLFDVNAILKQLQIILDQVTQAIQLLFLFAVAAGLLVLAIALMSTRDERIQEAALIRALGGTRSQLIRAQRLELLIIGALAGALAAMGASAMVWSLAHYVFDFDIKLSFWPALIVISIGMIGSWAGGAFALKGVLHTSPAVVLRKVI